MVAAELAAGYSALKNALDIAKGLKDIHDQVRLNSAVIDLQSQILTAQEGAGSARERIRELEATVAAYEAWDKTASRYQLKDYGDSTFAYELRSDRADGEPVHRACPKCFEDRRRSILQFDYTDNSHRDHYNCPACTATYQFGVRHKVSMSRHRGSGWTV